MGKGSFCGYDFISRLIANYIAILYSRFQNFHSRSVGERKPHRQIFQLTLSVYPKDGVYLPVDLTK